MLKKTFKGLLLTSGIGVLYLYPKFNNDNYNRSITRYVSRKVGQLMNITIPVSLRESLYLKYIELYNVNTDEIIEKDLKKYETLKEFFTREINVKRF